MTRRRARQWLLAVLAMHVAAAATPVHAASRFEPCTSEATPTFPAFFAGDSVRGHRLVHSEYVCARPRPGEVLRTNRTSYVYGDCDARGEPCAPPIEVQTWPVCDANAGLYSLYPHPFGGPRARRPVTVRGVPGAVFPSAELPAQLELYTADVTVRIFATSEEEARAVAAQLRSAPASEIVVGANGPLPDPIRGHLVGRVDCGLRVSGFPRRRTSHCVRCSTPGVRLRLRSARAATASVVFHRLRRGRETFAGVTQFRLRRGTRTYRLLRVTPGRTLARGRYRVAMVASDAEGRRSPVRSALVTLR